MNTIKVTGKISILPGGHKGTSFRDKNGNYHAEFFKATIGGVVGQRVVVDAGTAGASKDADGTYSLPSIDADTVRALGLKENEYYSFRWNERDAEEFANYPMGTIFKVTLTADTTTDVAGKTVVKCYKRPDSETINFDVHLVDWDVVKEGRHERRKFTQYIADVQAGNEEAAEDDNEVEDK